MTGPEGRLSAVWPLFSRPQAQLGRRLAAPPPVADLLIRVVLPACAVRAAAVALAGALQGEGAMATALACVHFVGLVLSWAAMAALLRAILREANLPLDRAQAAVCATFLHVPLWLAGLLYMVPESAWAWFLLGRLVELGLGAYGVRLLARGLRGTPPLRDGWLLWASVGGAFAATYGTIFACLGLVAHGLILVLGLEA